MARARGCNPCPFINLNTKENLFITAREAAEKNKKKNKGSFRE